MPALRSLFQACGSRALLPAAAVILHHTFFAKGATLDAAVSEDKGAAASRASATRAKAAHKREILKTAREFIKFADDSPSVFHAVDTIKTHLVQAGFSELEEKDDWTESVAPGGKYFVNRCGSSGSSIIAFAVGKQWIPGNSFSIVATHVDSPCLKVKPRSNITAAGFRQLGVEIYGGGLWHTWFDRDLGAAGRVWIRTSPSTIQSGLILVNEPMFRIPSIAVHLEKQNPFKFEVEEQLRPVLSQTALESSKKERREAVPQDLERVQSPLPYRANPAGTRHPVDLVDKIATAFKTHPKNIIDFELALYDLQKGSLGGVNDEFIYSARIDNLLMTFCTLKGFVNSMSKSDALDNESSIRTFVAFDKEEIGSVGPEGAQSNFLPSTLQRIAKTKYEQSMARSLLLSADVTHAVHPNYSSRLHEINHQPRLNEGVCFNSTSRKNLAKSVGSTIQLLEMMCAVPLPPPSDATSEISGAPASAAEDDEDAEDAHARALIESAPPITQHFVAPNGRDCGSTVGPHLESRMGIKVVDLGNTALSMHSVREMAGSHDVDNGVRFMRLFYENYSKFEGWVSVK